jgi:hypothetical protein
MATEPTIRLPNWPDSWFEGVTGTPTPDSAAGQPQGLLGGLASPREWNLEDSGLGLVLSPDEIKSIDFSGTGPPESPPWLVQAALEGLDSLIRGRRNLAAKAFIMD